MSETKFTPERWWVTKPGYIAADYDNDRYHGVAVVLSAEGSREEKADANLIAAAPDLYAALESLIEKLCYDDDEGLIEFAEPMIAARAALAKARGEAQ